MSNTYIKCYAAGDIKCIKKLHKRVMRENVLRSIHITGIQVEYHAHSVLYSCAGCSLWEHELTDYHAKLTLHPNAKLAYIHDRKTVILQLFLIVTGNH